MSAPRFDLLLQHATVAGPNGLAEADIGIRNGRIAALGNFSPDQAADSIDLTGLTILPGVMDTQVHLREPGLEHKEDLATGTAAAALGGITAVCEMPNTKPSTTTAAELADKLARAKGRAWVDHAFFIGAASDNIDHLAELERLPGCAGIKVFMGSSTGSLLVEDDDTLARVLAQGYRRVAVHCEDEARLRERKYIADQSGGNPASHPEWRDAETALRATTRLIRLARAARRRVHVLHVTSAGEMEFLADHKDLATVEATPQHLTLSAPDAYDRLGTFAQMNPPIRSEEHRLALWRALEQGIVDVIGSDHAPHTREEKALPYPQSPSGMTGVQTLVPVMLDHLNAGRLSLSRFIDLTSTSPARIYGMANKGRIAVGYDADFTIVDLKAKRKISHNWITSKCGWTPYDGTTVTGWPMLTVLRGQVVMREDELLNDPIGAPLRFQECLP